MTTAASVRDRGDPPNGASSLSLFWRLDSPARSARVILEVTKPPVVDELYFWAVQVSFADAGSRTSLGGAHLGLQWHPSFPGKTAVNWGGYTARGAELAGTASALPSATNDANTRNFRWRSNRRYELSVRRATGGGWLGTVTDLSTGIATTVRKLNAGGEWISEIVVWSEVFAACDAPAVAARWSGLEAGGRAVQRVTAGYQSFANGGCTNTDQRLDATGIVQMTKTRRTVSDGAVLMVPGRR